MQIVESLDNLLKSGAYSDFEFIIGNQKFPVHKAILYSKSNYFSGMFSNDCRENNTGSAYIEDIDADLFSELLQYFYTGQVPDMTEVDKAIKLLIIADKYQLNSLKLICETELSEKMLTPETMFNLLIAADDYNAPTLKNNALEFISARTTTMEALKGVFDDKVCYKKSKSLFQELTK